MARPKKQPDERRTASIRADLTMAEKVYIQEQASRAGMTEAEYTRRRLLGQPVQASPRRADASMLAELNRIGVNVNQLTRAVHTERDFVRYWQEIGGELRIAIEKVSRLYDR